jgi:hypothetical protein
VAFYISGTELRSGTRINVSTAPTTFNAATTVQEYTVPQGVFMLRATVAGAHGGSTDDSNGGYGARLETLIPVQPLQKLYLVVPQAQPRNQRVARALGGGGWGGLEDNIFPFDNEDAGAGGGYSGIFWSPTLSQATALIVAGGGGGGASGSTGEGGNGGYPYPGDGEDGQTANSFWGHNGGYGGTTTAGGAAGRQIDAFADDPTPGSALKGGDGASAGSSDAGGGGGGGWFGGGGGAAGFAAYGGGGGGSSWSKYPAVYLQPRSRAEASGSIILTPVDTMAPLFFQYTGGDQQYTIPAGVESLRITARGARGGYTATQSSGVQAYGGNVTMITDVTPGTACTIVVGGHPGNSRIALYGGGGSGGLATGNTMLSGGAGGGLAGMFTGTPTTANAVIVAGGGGGSSVVPQPSSDSFLVGGSGGGGGTQLNTILEGGPGQFPGTTGGGGGSSTTGGTAGTALVAGITTTPPVAGSALTGGNGGSTVVAVYQTLKVAAGGGGGAGYYGGGGGAVGVGSLQTPTGAGGGGGSWYNASQWREATSKLQFDYTAEVQTWTVPPGVTSITISAWGAAGGCSPQNFNIYGGLALGVTGTYSVTPGETLYIYVGGHPFNSSTPTPIGNAGAGGSFQSTFDSVPVRGAAGGGLSAVLRVPIEQLMSLSSREPAILVIAGGGGGATGSGSAAGDTYTGGAAGVIDVGSYGLNGINGSGGLGTGGGIGGTAVLAQTGVPVANPAFPNQDLPNPGYMLSGGDGGTRIAGTVGATGSGSGGGGGGYAGGSGGLSGEVNRAGGGGGGATVYYNRVPGSYFSSAGYGGYRDHGRIVIDLGDAYPDAYVFIQQNS